MDSKNIFIVGAMGSGKSSIGKLLAKQMDKEFIDTDHEIEKIYNYDISTIFQKYGEEKSSNKIIKYLDQFKKENGEFVVSVDSNFSKDISSKNKKGNPETFSMKLNVEIVLENADITINNSFIEIVSYNNKDSKFKLKEFERKLKNNLIEKISQDIVTYIQSL